VEGAYQSFLAGCFIGADLPSTGTMENFFTGKIKLNSRKKLRSALSKSTEH
jgi:hypothetical protein